MSSSLVSEHPHQRAHHERHEDCRHPRRDREQAGPPEHHVRRGEEAEEHGGNPEDCAAAMQGGEAPAQPAEDEAGAEGLPFKKKKPGFLAKGLGLQ